jgi:hypothetical protein
VTGTGFNDPGSGNALKDEVNQFEEQYNPLHDYQVFDVGNRRAGGQQTLQQKMNLAEDESEESVNESDGVPGDNSVQKILDDQYADLGEGGERSEISRTPRVRESDVQMVDLELPKDD